MSIDQLKKYGKPQKFQNFDVVTIHPLADELQLRKRLNISPEDCWLCGLYWSYQNYLYYVDICCKRLVQENSIINCWIREGAISFYVVIDSKYVSSVEVIKILKYLSNYLDHNDLNHLKPQTLKLLNIDVLTLT